MSHEFLTSLHSHVIETSGAKTIGAMGKVEQLVAKRSRGRPRTETTDAERHRTVGVSMSPKLQARTAARAREVGLSFSRYVQWCLEAELDQVPLAGRFRQLE